MIKSVDINNFQSHRDTHVELSPGVNVFVGASDEGKSVILRAIDWVATNRPAGDAFRSDWGGDTAVVVEIGPPLPEYGYAFVARVKGDKKNEYAIGNEVVGTTDVFKAMGQGIPAEVEAALNLAPINTQHQMDSPFLLSSDWSPGRVAEYLNEAAGLDAIDRATAAINATVRSIAGQLAVQETLAAELGAKLTALDYIDGFEKELVRVEAEYTAAASARRSEQEWNNCVAGIKTLREQITALPDYVCAVIKLDALLVDEKEATRLDANWRALDTAARMVEQTQDDLTAVKTMTLGGRLLNRIMELERDRASQYAKHGDISQALFAVENSRTALTTIGKDIDRREADWKLRAPDTCPLCEGKGKLK